MAIAVTTVLKTLLKLFDSLIFVYRGVDVFRSVNFPPIFLQLFPPTFLAFHNYKHYECNLWFRSSTQEFLVHSFPLTQGWEFAHRFSEWIARFLRKNEWFINFWWVTWAFCSHCSLKKREWANRLFKTKCRKKFQKIRF